MDEENTEAVIQKVANCIDMLLISDAYLFDANVHEQTIAARLCIYLSEAFRHHDVDAEFNRHGLDVKKLDYNGKERLVRPDIVVHERGSDKRNLVVIEIKRPKTRARARLKDREKLHALVCGGAYRYKVGVFLHFRYNSAEKRPTVDPEWFLRDECVAVGA